MKKIIIVLVITLFIAAPLFAEEYKSMCELYPKQCAASGLAKLGDTTKGKTGNEYKVIAEAKHSFNDIWVQFIDVKTVGGVFDGECNIAVFFILKEDGFYGKSFTCNIAKDILMRQCEIEGIEYDDYVHKAK